MSFLSIEFLVFAALTLLAYYLFPLRIRPLILVIASGAFVVFSGWHSAVHLAGIALLAWGGAWALSAQGSRPRWKKALLTALLILDFGAMATVKYGPALSAALGGDTWQLALPLGLSYFTFQSAGYLIDVYRGKAQAVKNPLRIFLFLGYGPQLPQGPISTWKELEHQLSTGHRLEPLNLVAGFQLMLWGYFQKLVIADRLAATTAALLEGEHPGWFALGGVALYTLRLYADFAGGVNVARGLSRMLGIQLPVNFRRPFFASSVADYWRRWHITLGTWFRAYVMYPLVVSRWGVWLSQASGRLLGKKTGRSIPAAVATLLVFVLIGVWHMASWNAVFYGLYFGLVMAVSLLLEPVWKRLRTSLRLPKEGWMKPLRVLRTWGLVLLAQYFAFTSSPEQALGLLRETFSVWNFADFAERCAQVMPALEWMIAGMALLVMAVVDLLSERHEDLGERLAAGPVWLRWPLLIALIVAIVVFGCYGASYDGAAFMYTQF